MIVRRRGDYDGVQFTRGCNLLVAVGADEKLRCVQSRIALGLLDLIEVRAGLVELVLKQVGQRDDAGATGINQIRCVFSAAPAATQQTDAHGGVSGGTTYQLGLDEHNARGSRDTADKFPAVQLVGEVRAFF